MIVPFPLGLHALSLGSLDRAWPQEERAEEFSGEEDSANCNSHASSMRAAH